ncbi:protein of unknown function [Methylorubrum extorquens DM4]|uniref:Uncharacterized protein n=1 Tax=Methylorubrum extorquens (strain DSM 6343 / CIP 106787 / DM4) TaxID=661410 RepID=A0A2P9HAU6_METED|nr:protein of unknown function [Methylorubrum extorquens DM4]
MSASEREPTDVKFSCRERIHQRLHGGGFIEVRRDHRLRSGRRLRRIGGLGLREWFELRGRCWLARIPTSEAIRLGTLWR